MSVPAVDIERVVLVGQVHCTSAAQRFFLEQGIDTIFLSWNGRLKGRLGSSSSPRPKLRMAQYRAHDATGERVLLARAFIRAKLSNMQTMLRRYAQRRSAPALSESADTVSDLKRRAAHAEDLDGLRGMEGQATRVYYEAWPLFINRSDPTFSFSERTRRPPEDAVNALLSFGYTLLLGDMQVACATVGLDPSLGFLHTLRRGCPSCALDLVEAFRPTVADSVVLRLLNERRIAPDDVTSRDEGVFLTRSGREAFYAAYEERRQTTVTPPGLGSPIAYHRAFEAQARMLTRSLTSGADYVPFTIR